jgi:hypothetical protein
VILVPQSGRRQDAPEETFDLLRGHLSSHTKEKQQNHVPAL